MGGIIGSVASVALPAVASYFAPGVAGALGVTSALGTAAVGAGMGALASAATGGNPLTGAITGGIGGYIAAPTTAAVGAGSALPADIQASIQAANPTMSAADAQAAAQAYASQGYTSANWGSSIGAGGSMPLQNLFKPTGQNALSQLTGLAPNTISSIGQGAASLYGAQMGADAAKAATAETTRQFNIAQQNQAPWLAAGQKALAEQQKLLFGTPQDIQTSLQGTPGYQFRLQQGQQGLDAGLAARGGMGSGKSAVAASEYNQNFATNEYQNALNRLSGTGQTTATDLAKQGAGYSQVMGDVGMKAAAQRQSGLLGSANALTSYVNPTKQIAGYNAAGNPIFAP